MEKKSVLFLCTANSARSQMAEALLRSMAGDQYDACSAGLEPKEVNPNALKVLSEIRVDTEGLHSKGVGEFLGRKTIHYAIIVCSNAEKQCPRVYPFCLNVLSWPFPDPAAASENEVDTLMRFREVRDQIKTKISAWLEVMGAKDGVISGTNAG